MKNTELYDYARELKAALLTSCPQIERLETAQEEDEDCLFHVCGRGKDHSFSVKLTTFPQPSIWVYGYGDDMRFPLTGGGMQGAFSRCREIASGGGLINIYDGNGGHRASLEFVAPISDAAQLRAFYADYLKNSGKYAPLERKLVYTNFGGTVRIEG